MQANKTSHKRSPSSDSITRSINLGEFRRRFCFVQLSTFEFLVAGAKLVLPPAGEIPQLKPVNINRPRMPPPPGPPNGKNSWNDVIDVCNSFLLSADKSIANGQSSESLNSLNDANAQNASRVQGGTPIRKVSEITAFLLTHKLSLILF